MICKLSYKRQIKPEVKIKDVVIGGSHPIVIQSMTDTSTNDIENSIKQSIELIQKGAQMIRFTTQGEKEINNLAIIKQQLQSKYNVPIIADVHFRPDIADKATEVADKVRINPGNYAKNAPSIKPQFAHLIKLCQNKNVALRIGVNHGSLNKRILEKYGNTAQGMVESCMEFLYAANECNFKNIVLSVKASNSKLMYETVMLLNQTMLSKNMNFPLHIGVTEAGSDEDGRIKSAVGIGAVLAQGLGDTIRVSLSEPPTNEIPIAQGLVNYFTSPNSNRYTKTSVEIKNNTISYTSLCNNWKQFVIEAAAECGHLLWDNHCSNLIIKNPNFDYPQLHNLQKDILQATGIIKYKNEYIACPGCGRTMFDLQTTLQQIKQATAHLTGLKIAVMGCIVNGIGEMGDADYGYVGAGKNKVSLYKNSQCVLANIVQEEAVSQLLALIEKK